MDALGFGLQELLVLLPIAVIAAAYIMLLKHVIKREDLSYAARGIWVCVILIAPLVGAVTYFAWARPKA